MNVNESKASKPLTLAAIQDQFAQWRATGRAGRRIPGYLWEAVRDLTQQYTPNQLAEALKLNPSKVLAITIAPPQQDNAIPDFIEVPVLPSLSPPRKADFHVQGVFELTRPDGTTLKAVGLSNQNLFFLSKSFMEQ